MPPKCRCMKENIKIQHIYRCYKQYSISLYHIHIPYLERSERGFTKRYSRLFTMYSWWVHCIATWKPTEIAYRESASFFNAKTHIDFNGCCHVVNRPYFVQSCSTVVVGLNNMNTLDRSSRDVKVREVDATVANKFNKVELARSYMETQWLNSGILPRILKLLVKQCRHENRH